MTKKQPRVIDDLSLLEIEEKDHFDLEIEESLKQSAFEKESSSFFKRFSFTHMFFFCVLILILLNFYLWGENLVVHLFEHHNILGWFGLIISILAVFAFFGFIFCEIRLIYKLSNANHIRQKAIKAYEEKDKIEALHVLKMISHFTKNEPLVHQGQINLQALDKNLLSYDEILYSIETEILSPLDKKAIKIVLTSMKRLSIVTTLTPRFFFEFLYILFETIHLVRKIANLYGCRPGNFGNFQILRAVFHHLSVTTGLSLTDNFFEQFLGHNLAARLSARLGEGFINGIMISRVGLAAIEVLRPFPFLQKKRPVLKDILSQFIRKTENEN